MKFGKNMVVEIKEIGDLVEMKISGVKAGIKITPTDFGLDLHRRKMEGVTPDPREEIDVISGICDEVTTGEDIIFEYLYGDKLSAIILAGTIAKKQLPYEVKATALEIGGINTNEQNKDYITIAIQKMLGTNDSIGGVVECVLPYTLEVTSSIKGEFSRVIYELIEEVSAIQFGNGILDSRSNAKDYQLAKNKILVTFGPHMASKKIIPCLAAVRDVVVESVLSVVLL
jgi:chorismate synthase